MDLPFSTDQFLAVFRRYNETVWPMQIALYALALMVIGFAWHGSDRRVLRSLAAMWAWMGLVYHWGFFTAINPAAWAFGALFGAQALLLLVMSRRATRPSFAIRRDLFGITGGILVAYALVGYPLLGRALGHAYPASPTFGLPCPTTIFTFGIYLWADRRLSIWTVVVPALWSGIGFLAAVALSMTEDYGLLVAGLAGTLMIVWRRASPPPAIVPSTAGAPRHSTSFSAW